MQRNEEAPVAVTDATFAKAVLEAPQPVLVDWCRMVWPLRRRSTGDP